MKRFARTALVIVTAVVTTSAWAYDSDRPDDPAAVAAAKTALRALGPNRGGLAVAGEVRKLVGVTGTTRGGGLDVAGQVEDLARAIKDLGAQVRPMEIQVTLASDVLFDFDKAAIRPAAVPELKKLALIIRKKATGEVLIQGHTDAKGSDAYNQTLSERRAQGVKQWLVEHGGIDPAIMKTTGFGETRPVAVNNNPDGSDNPEGRQKNRRVEVTIRTGR